MRRSIAKKGQELCFLCALRLEAAAYTYPSAQRGPRQVRGYQTTSSAWRPGGIAAARRDDHDDTSSTTPRSAFQTSASGTPAELFWACRCGHYNKPRRTECTICNSLKPSGAQLVPKPAPALAVRAAPPTSAPAPQQLSTLRSPANPSEQVGRNQEQALLADRLSQAAGPRNVPQATQRLGHDGSRPQSRFAQPQQDALYGRPGQEKGAQRSRFGARLDQSIQNTRPNQGQGFSFGEIRKMGYDDSQGRLRQERHPGAAGGVGERSTSSAFGGRPRTQFESSERSSRFGNFLGDLARSPQPQASRTEPPSTQRVSQSGPSNVGRGLDALLAATASPARPQTHRDHRPAPPFPQPNRSTEHQRPQSFQRTRNSLESDPVFRSAFKNSARPAPGKGGHAQPTDNSSIQIPAVDGDTDGTNDVSEYDYGNRRRGFKTSDANADRRREKFVLDDAAENPSEVSSKQPKKGAFAVSRDPRAVAFDLEMADVEARLDGEDPGGRRRKKKTKKKADVRPRVEIPEFTSVQDLAKLLKLKLETFIEELEEEGFEGARYDHILDAQTSIMFAEMHGFDVSTLETDIREDIVARPPHENPTSLPQRPPIVTIMGHVDHGKTTILDFLRKSAVVASEHGGITQHIGAFSVVMPGTQRKITFLDTPGHAAFLDMRRRGANVTDIVVLVVAADDSVMPQTKEAIKHARDAGVQMIVAINKVDKEDANIDKVKQDLAREEVSVEDYGGDIQAIPLSGKTGMGMEALEEAIITLADVSDFRADSEGMAEGTIIESKVTTAGRVATILVRRGTLKVGDCIVAGSTWARVRTLKNDAGQLVEEALPGTPVQVDGWRGEDPTAGLEVLQANDEQHAKDVVELRTEKMESIKNAADMASLNITRSEQAAEREKVLAWEQEQGWLTGKRRGGRPWDNEGWVEPEAASGPKRVHFVVKADVAGSVEAIVAAVSAIGNNDVVANVVHSGTGHLGESDIRLLAATGEVSYAINFNQSIEGTIHRLAEAAGVSVMDHNIIYKVTDQVKEKLEEEMPPLITQKVLGEAEVGQIFDITLKKGKKSIAGCKVTNGTIMRSQKVRVLRNNEEIYSGTLESLKNVKKDATEMRKGTECGMSFENWEEFQPGDKIQCFEEVHEKRKLY